MTVPDAPCPHEVWDYEKAGDKRKKTDSGLAVMICHRCGERTIPGPTTFSALSYMDPNRLRDMAIDEPERYRQLVEKAEAQQAEAVRAAKAREARANARRNAPTSNGKRPNGSA